jgi:energy-coupling factor transport system substrate-specific component
MRELPPLLTRRASRPLLVAANAVGAAAFAWPFVLPGAVGGNAAHAIDAPWIMLGLLVSLGGLLFVQLGRGGMGPKAVALLGILAAAMVALRLPGYVAGASAMVVVVLVAGASFGPSFGFVLGSVGTFASGLFVGGVGPWLPFQMIAVGWVGMGAGLVPRDAGWRARIAMLAAYGFVAGYVFGAVMNLWFWPFGSRGLDAGWAPQLGGAANFRRYLTFYLQTSFAWDTARAIGNTALVLVLGRPLLATLDRAARRLRVEVRAGNAHTGGQEPPGWPRPGDGSRKVGTPQGRTLGKSQAGRPAESATESRPPLRRAQARRTR